MDLHAEFPGHGPGFPVVMEIAGLPGPDPQAADGQGAHAPAMVKGAVEQACDEDGCVPAVEGLDDGNVQQAVPDVRQGDDVGVVAPLGGIADGHQVGLNGQ